MLSSEPETTFRPSGEYATLVTPLVCPVSGSPTGAPVCASQIRIVLSQEPETTFRPSGEYATLVTSLGMPCQWLAHRCSRLRIPDSDRVVIGARDDILAIWRVCNTRDTTGMSCQWLAHRCSRLRIPDSDRVVPGARDDIPAIWRVCNTRDTRWYVLSVARPPVLPFVHPRFGSCCHRSQRRRSGHPASMQCFQCRRYVLAICLRELAMISSALRTHSCSLETSHVHFSTDSIP